MIWILAFGIALLMAAVAVLANAKSTSPSEPSYPYEKKSTLFTPAERSFLGVLDQLLGSEYRVMGKVRVADLIQVKSLDDKKAQKAAFNRISAKHFDFVLCNKNDLSPIAVIELDDKSHTAKKRRERDELIEGVCRAAALLLLRLPARRAYTRSDVERLVLSRLPQQALANDAPVTESNPGLPTPAEALASKQELAEPPQCPKCSSRMILRKVKRGARAGEKLWGCRDYPICRGILPLVAATPPDLGSAAQ